MLLHYYFIYKLCVAPHTIDLSNFKVLKLYAFSKCEFGIVTSKYTIYYNMELKIIAIHWLFP